MKKQPLIVVVEDNPMYRALLVHHFELEGRYEIAAFADAESCLKQLKAPPAALLLDQELQSDPEKGLSGLQLLKRLRRRGIDAPALFLTAHPAVQPAAEILKGGAFGYMRKEYTNLGTVCRRIDELMEWKRLDRDLEGVKSQVRGLRRRTWAWLGLLLLLLMGVVLLP